MYNLKFLLQLEASRQHLFGALEPREAADRVNNYVPPEKTEVIECEENRNGEWIPRRALEGKITAQ